MGNSNRNGHVLIITYWSFKDALIQTYTLPYVKMIRRKIDQNEKVYLVTLEQSTPSLSKAQKAEIEGGLKREGIYWLPFNYRNFGLLAAINSLTMIISLWWKIGQLDINTIHTWCTPAGGLGWILSKLTRKRLILDSYEPHAEPMVEAGQWDRDSLAFRILFWLEKGQSKHAEVAIGCVSAMETYASEKYNAKFEKFFVKPAGVNFDLFHPSKRKSKDLVERYGLEGKTVFVYAGKFGGSYLSLETFELLKQAQDFYGDRFAAILLNNHPEEYIEEMSHKVGLKDDSVVHAFVPHDQVPEYMGLGDIGLVPFIPVPSKRYGSPIKTAEYLSMGIPIIITKGISDDSDFIADNNLGFVIDDLNTTTYQAAIGHLDQMLNSDPEIAQRCRQSVMSYRSFDQAERIYEELYTS